MTNSDLQPFLDAFHRLKHVFPLRGEAHELHEIEGSYFRALRRYPLAAVEAGVDAWMAKGAKFPKPAEWSSAIPRSTQSAIQLETLSDSEAREYHEAEKLGWEGQPCLCSDCSRAGVDERPLRYVPEFDANGNDLKAQTKTGQIIVRGHWAHGDELARWYLARANFWNAMYERFGATGAPAQRRMRRTFEHAMTEIFQESGKRTRPHAVNA